MNLNYCFYNSFLYPICTPIFTFQQVFIELRFKRIYIRRIQGLITISERVSPRALICSMNIYLFIFLLYKSGVLFVAKPEIFVI